MSFAWGGWATNRALAIEIFFSLVLAHLEAASVLPSRVQRLQNSQQYCCCGVPIASLSLLTSVCKMNDKEVAIGYDQRCKLNAACANLRGAPHACACACFFGGSNMLRAPSMQVSPLLSRPQ